MAVAYMQFIACFEILRAAWEVYLLLRQKTKFEATKISQALDGLVPPDKFQKAQKYGTDKANLEIIEHVIETPMTVASYFLFMIPAIWTWAGYFLLFFKGEWARHEILQSIMFVVISGLFSSVTSMPFSLYRTFILEARYGFNKTTPATYIKDFFLSTALTVVFAFIFIPPLWFILDRSGPYLWLYFFSFGAIVIVLMTVVVPSVIQPLFNKFTPLDDGPLKEEINKMASSLKFPLAKLYVIDGSKRSNHSNAYFYGIFSKGIVLFDSLLEQTKGKDDQVLAVLAHELGHWKMGHTLRGMALALINLLVTAVLYGMAAGNQDLFRSFGFTESQPHIVGLVLFMTVTSVLDPGLGFLFNWMSRTMEYQADKFAKDMGYSDALSKGLITLQVENLSNMNPDYIYSAYHNSHPTLIERLEAIGYATGDDKKEK